MTETGLSRATIYRRMKTGTFPIPVRLGVRSIGWRVTGIEIFYYRLPTIKRQPGARRNRCSLRNRADRMSVCSDLPLAFSDG
ncbi:AlpA family phage regulatory protein [Paraburkholderia nemoris]|uniref:helix-turn-helix transcriptional regulator n=1 Tax=Paraburkholderia nemoris TaxID=2793076 RepID=UPI0038B6F786